MFDPLSGAIALAVAYGIKKYGDVRAKEAYKQGRQTYELPSGTVPETRRLAAVEYVQQSDGSYVAIVPPGASAVRVQKRLR